MNTGAANGGGDTDVEVADDHTVYVADLEAAATDICTSHDFGKTFEDCDNGLAKNQQGPENDRQWLTRGPGGELYLTYHDFAAGFPIIERSTDGGKSVRAVRDDHRPGRARPRRTTRRPAARSCPSRSSARTARSTSSSPSPTDRAAGRRER